MQVIGIMFIIITDDIFVLVNSVNDHMEVNALLCLRHDMIDITIKCSPSKKDKQILLRTILVLVLLLCFNIHGYYYNIGR